MKIYLQHDERDCGAACLAMVAAHYGLRLPISRCRELTKTDKTGTNLYGLADGAGQIGLRAQALSGTAEDLLDGLRKGEISFPFVAHTVSEDAMLHYMVVYGEKQDGFLVADPARGKRRLSREAFFRSWTGYIVTFEKTDGFRPGNFTRGGFLRFFRLLRGQEAKLAGVLAASLVIAAIGILGALVFQVVLDGFATDQGYYEEMEEEGHTHEEEHDHGPIERFLEQAAELAGRNFNRVFLALIFLYLLHALISFLRGYLVISVSRAIDLRLTLSYYNHILDLPVSSIAVRQTGEYLSRFSDSDAIRQAVSGATVTLILDSLMAVAGGVILFLENRRLFAVSLVMILLYAAIVLIYRKPVERSNRQVMERNALLQSYFKESIDGAETVKAAGAGEQVKEKTTEKFQRFLDSVVKNGLIAVSQDALAGAVEMIGTAIILWMGFAMILAGKSTVGALMSFYALLSFFTEPIKNLIELQPTIQTALVAADRLNDILDLQTEQGGSEDPAEPMERWELRNVDFRYGNRELTLRDVCFSVRKGERVAIVGESGSGKTTLAKLLLRFYQPERGEIVINDRDIREYSLAHIRRKIAYVDQNTVLFSDTVRNNLTLGNPAVSEEALRRALEDSSAAEFIDALPMGLDTPLDENGSNLSGGQRQRLAIARALLKKPELLILDEATSNLDTVTESAVRDAMFSLSGLTCVIIAHRLSTVRNCDRIYVMDRGRMVEQGSHEELTARGGAYAALWKRQ